MLKNFSKDKLIKIFKDQLKIRGKFKESSKIYYYKKWDALATLNRNKLCHL